MIISKGIGIDLGTTNSAVAIMNPADTDVRLYQDKESRTTVPSCVWRKSTGGDVVVGHGAHARRGSRPEPVMSVKRKMGTTLLTSLGPADSIPENLPPTLRAKLVADRSNRPRKVTSDGEPESGQETNKDGGPLLWLPEELSACIISDLMSRVTDTLKSIADEGEQYTVDRGIITVPAYFDMCQIEATREAGKLAGLEVIDLLHEPTAAAVYYSWRHQIPDGIFMVYDLGGGTFDISVLRRTQGEFEVLGISGDNFMGGDDFDRLLAEWICQNLIDEGYELTLRVDSDAEDAIRFRQLMALAERVKKALSRETCYVLRDQNTLTDQSGERVFIEMQIERSILEDRIQGLLWRTVPKCWEGLARTYRRSGVTLKDIDHILLVGGSTNMPLVQKLVVEQFCASANGTELSTDFILAEVDDELRELVRKLLERKETTKCRQPVLDSPGACVAMGAAIRAAAAGTFVYDDERRVRVFFRSQVRTKTSQPDLMGFVQSGDGRRPLEGVTVRLTGDDERVLGEQVVQEQGHFRFCNLPLWEETVSTLRVAVFDAKGEPLAQISRQVTQSTEQRDLGSVLSTAVLSKPILIEIADQDRLVRGVLLEEGSSLPSSGTFRFFLRDHSGVVRFPLYQGNRPIREVTARVDPSLDIGTPVDLEVQCDHLMYVRLSIRVGAQEFGLDMGPPPPPSAPSGEEIAELITQFRARIGELDAEERESFLQRFDSLLQDLRHSIGAGDDSKSISRFAEMESLLKAMDLRTPKLDPPWGEIERLCAATVDMFSLARLFVESFDFDESRRVLAEYRESARRAYAVGDQQLYMETHERIKTYAEGLRQQLAERLAGEHSSHVSDEQAATLSLADIARRVSTLRLFAFGSARNDLLERLQQILAESKKKEEEVASEPVNVLRWCAQKRRDLARYQEQLRGAEQGPQLRDGVLSLSAPTVTKGYTARESKERIERRE